MTHSMPDAPIDMRDKSEDEVADAARFLEADADYILAFRQPHTPETQWAVIALLFALHTPAYVREALTHFHAEPAQADLFYAVYEAHYELVQHGIKRKPRPARHYLLPATAPAPGSPPEARA